MKLSLRCLSLATVVACTVLLPSVSLHAQGGSDALIVRCERPCAAIRALVSNAGGTVTRDYDNIEALAVRLPASATSSLLALAGPDAVHKDVFVNAPRPVVESEVTTSQVDISGSAGGIDPANYDYNLTVNNVASLHAAGQIGQDVVVAVIDSGTVNVPASIPALTGSVIGGETFVPPAIDTRSATDRENGSHGTMTAEMVAAHGLFGFAATSTFVRALDTYMPGSAIPVSPTVTAVPMTGTAPGAKIYAMKVFPAQGGGAASSWIIGAMDRAITLRRNFNTTGANAVSGGTGTETDPFVYRALKIDVVNLSLGGATLYAGHDIEDQLTLAMLEVGITPVVSAGNDGFVAMTIGSPGSGYGSLTVGAASTAPHERVVREVQFGTGFGELYRPTTHIQTANFSSRGPNADGRNDPDMTANGAFSFVHAFMATTAAGALVDCREPGAVAGTCVPRIVFASGTSFSSPTVAGGAAVLRAKHPASNAKQIRNALHNSANPNALGDDSTSIDQGKGLLDVGAADALLTSGHVSSKIPDLGSSRRHDGEDELGAGGGSVMLNVMKAGHRIAQFRGNSFSTRVSNLKPGEVAQIFVPSDSFTSKLTVTIDQVVPELAPSAQNQLFGDDIFYIVGDAPTSVLVEKASGFVANTVTHVIENPQTGLVRVSLQGDWTNAGKVSARVTVARERSIFLPSALSIIDQDEVELFEFDVPAASTEAIFELAWKQNWSRYPTNDLDMVLIDPSGAVNQSGATLSSPERVRIANPSSGRWTVAVVGFTVHGNFGHVDEDDSEHRRDIFTLRAEADGKRLKQK
jgi:subtilisin family serine protease